MVYKAARFADGREVKGSNPEVESNVASRVGVGIRILGTNEMTGPTPVASSTRG